MKKTLVTVVGARPQFVKAATLSRLFAKSSVIEEALVHTGQHFDASMSQVFFDELEIPKPAHSLEVHGLPHGAMTGRMLEGIEEILLAKKPVAMLVYGDTNSTLAGALAAAKLSIPVIHIEAGLRSFNRAMPEEINRVMTDHLSSLLLCPTRESVRNLANEGITRNVHHIGDVMYDAARHALELAKKRPSIVDAHGLALKSYMLATIHRQENTDSKENLSAIITYIAKEAGDMQVLLPLHPRTKKMLAQFGIALPSIMKVCEPLGFVDMHGLLAGAACVYTDSGGVQKEAYFHQVPCVTLRNETEWVETIEHGWNRLWKTPDYQPRQPITDYGSGNAASECVRQIEAFLA